MDTIHCSGYYPLKWMLSAGWKKSADMQMRFSLSSNLMSGKAAAGQATASPKVKYPKLATRASKKSRALILTWNTKDWSGDWRCKTWWPVCCCQPVCSVHQSVCSLCLVIAIVIIIISSITIIIIISILATIIFVLMKWEGLQRTKAASLPFQSKAQSRTYSSPHCKVG